MPATLTTRAIGCPDFEAILDSLPQPVIVLTPSGGTVYANAAAAVLGFGIGAEAPAWFLAEAMTYSGGTSMTADKRVLAGPDGARFSVSARRMAGSVAVVSLFPVADAREARPSDTDALTGLSLRGDLFETLDGLSEAPAGGGLVAVHCLDLDRFKLVNDTLGHGVGDMLLKKVADRLRSACRKGDCIARIGGDEFVVVQAGLAGEEDATKLAARLVDLIGRTYVLGGHTVNIGTSIGVAFQRAEVPARDLVRHADLALYEAKKAGRSRFRLYEDGMDASLRERREMEIDLRRALALRQFELHYQPFIELATDTVMGFEALVRWNHPVRGRVSPLDFIALAEETGLINPIGDWVLRAACKAASSWPRELTVAVNVSPVQFKSETLVANVVSALAEAGLPASRLEIEITEGALLENTDSVLTTLGMLRDLGVKISMDDFGTGYSSLSYLQKFPFHKIKIDRSFVQAAESGGDSEAILRAIASLGSSLGMAITAEGVETSEQLGRVRLENCTHAQGYLTGRPMPAHAVADFLVS